MSDLGVACEPANSATESGEPMWPHRHRSTCVPEQRKEESLEKIMSKTNDTEGFNTGSMVPNLRPSENPDTPAVAGTHGRRCGRCCAPSFWAELAAWRLRRWWMSPGQRPRLTYGARAVSALALRPSSTSARQPGPPTPERRHRLIPGSKSSIGGPGQPGHLDRHPAPARCRRRLSHRSSRLPSPATSTASARSDARVWRTTGP